MTYWHWQGYALWHGAVVVCCLCVCNVLSCVSIHVLLFVCTVSRLLSHLGYLPHLRSSVISYSLSPVSVNPFASVMSEAFVTLTQSVSDCQWWLTDYWLWLAVSCVWMKCDSVSHSYSVSLIVSLNHSDIVILTNDWCQSHIVGVWYKISRSISAHKSRSQVTATTRFHIPPLISLSTSDPFTTGTKNSIGVRRICI